MHYIRHVESIADADRAYFDAQLVSNREYWRRFGSRPAVARQRVLDVGCGHGALSLELAQDGATVLGVDLDERRIAWAAQNLRDNYSHLASLVEFTTRDVHEMPGDEQYDLIVTKDTVEHVDDMGAMLKKLASLLRPGGELWAGFSPLYYSPWGDHGRTGLRVPWAHAVLPRRLVYRAASAYTGGSIHHLRDLGLNGMTPAEFREYADDAGLVPRVIHYNRGSKPLLEVLGQARRLAALERYATVSMYAIYRLRGDD